MRRLYETLMRALGYALVLIFGLMVVDVLWQVASRYVLGAPSSFTEEFARFALIWVTLLGAALLNGRREHLAMDFLTRRLSAAKLARRQRQIEWWMFGFALVVLVVGGGNLVLTTLRLGQVSPAIGIPLWVVYAVVPAAGALVCFFSAYHATREQETGGPEARETYGSQTTSGDSILPSDHPPARPSNELG